MRRRAGWPWRGSRGGGGFAGAAGVAVVVVSGLVLAGCSGVADSVSAPNGSGWDPVKVAPLAQVAAGSGAPVASYGGSVVSGEQGLAVSLRPWLRVKPAAGGQYTFTVMSVGGARDKTVWSGEASGGPGQAQVQVPPDVLVNGQVYLWQASPVGSPSTVYGPYTMVVDTHRAGLQPFGSFGAVGVDLASGALSLSTGSRSVAGASGSLGVMLRYRVDEPGGVGVPAGWSLTPSGQAWDHLRAYPGGAVAMVAATGRVFAYTRSGDGSAYTPVTPAGRPASTGDYPALAGNKDGSWTATTSSGMVVMFGPADAGTGVAGLTGVFSGTTAAPQYEYSGGSLTGVKDAVSPDLRVDLRYQGGGDCPDVPEGFVDAPEGMLCQISYPDSSSTQFFYQANSGAGGGVLLARMLDYAGQGQAAAVTDFGYDQAPRLVAVREPAAAAALASGVRADAAELTTDVGYDSSGRVVSVTKPAASNAVARPSHTISYDVTPTPSAGAPGQSTISAAGPKTTTGFSSRHTYDPVSLLPASTTDSKGYKTTDVWDPATDRHLSSTDHLGRTLRFDYDEQGQPAATVGPYTGPNPVASTYTETYAHDQDMSGPSPRNMRGFDVTYWPNATGTGAPAGRDSGPRIGGQVPANAAFDWPGAPAGMSGAWSARLSGVLTAGGGETKTKTKAKTKTKTKAKAKAGNALTYRFAVAPGGVRLWVDGVECATGEVAGSCSLPLTTGAAHQLRVDVPVSGGAGAGLSLSWAPPGASSLAPIPMSAISPGYGLASAITKTDAFSAGTSALSTVVSDFEQPWSGKPSSGWVKDAPGMRGGSAYEAFNPGAGGFGRSTSSTLPAGNQIVYDYYSPGETPETGCEAMDPVAQHGRPKTTTRTLMPAGGHEGNDTGGQVYQHFYDSIGRTVAEQVNGTVTGCRWFDEAGRAAKTFIPGRGDQPDTTITYDYDVGGDPFQGAVNYQVGDTEYTSSARTDLYGRTLSATDVWGTTSTAAYDPLTGDALSTATTLPNGQKTSSAYTYSDDGDLLTVTVDGQTQATLTPPTPDGGTVTYANGVTAKAAPDSIGGFGSQTWTDTAGKQFSYTTTKSPAKRVLSEKYVYGADTRGTTRGTAGGTAGADTAAFAYTYDPSGRLTNAVLDTNLPATHKSWEYGFGTPDPSCPNAKAGMNSNRVKQVIDNTTTIGYCHNTQDQLTSTTDPAVGAISHSDQGEITNLGSVTIDYDTGGNAAKVADTNGDTITYTRLAGAVIAKTVTDTNPTPTNTKPGDTKPGDTKPDTVPGPTTPVTTTSRYSGGGYILDENNNPKVRVMPLPGGVNRIQDLTANTNTWQHETARGQHMWTSDSAGADTGERDLYSPYGEPLTTPAPATGADPRRPDLAWQAGAGLETQQVGETTIIDMGARLYIPALGRFTTTDPINQGSANAYDYANQDPINQTDPSGTMSSNVAVLIQVGLFLAAAAITMATDGLALPAIGVTANSAGFYAASTLVATGAAAGAEIAGDALLHPHTAINWERVGIDAGINLALGIATSYIQTLRAANAAERATTAAATAAAARRATAATEAEAARRATAATEAEAEAEIVAFAEADPARFGELRRLNSCALEAFGRIRDVHGAGAEVAQEVEQLSQLAHRAAPLIRSADWNPYTIRYFGMHFF